MHSGPGGWWLDRGLGVIPFRFGPGLVMILFDRLCAFLPFDEQGVEIVALVLDLEFEGTTALIVGS